MASGRKKKTERLAQRRNQFAEAAQAGTSQADPSPSGPPIINVNAKYLIGGIVSFCIFAELLFVFLDATVNYASWSDYGMFRRLCNIAREDGLASWFGTTQTWMIGMTLGLISMVAWRDKRPRFSRYGWLFLTIFFLYMSADDGAEIHERIGSAYKKYHTTYAETEEVDTFGEKALDFFPSYTWQIVFMPFFGAVGIFLMFFLWRELESNKARFFVFVAIGIMCFGVYLDFVEGLEDYHEGPDEYHPLDAYAWIIYSVDISDFTRRVFDRNPYDTLRHFSKSIEECMEMMANSIMWGVFLTKLVRAPGGLAFRFTGGKLEESASDA